MDFSRWIYLIFAVVVWAAVFLLIKPQRIKELLPIGLIAAIVLYVIGSLLISLDVVKFKQDIFFFARQPIFYLLWGAGSGILLMNYIEKEFSKKIPLVILFALGALAFEHVAEILGAYKHVEKFTFTLTFIVNIFALSLLVWVSEGLFGDRIHKHKVKS